MSAESAAGGARRRGPRPRHTREQVIEAAVAIADSDGLDAVTIRAVAARLGASAMSLYSYVPGKQALVYEMVDHVGGEVRLPDKPSGDWRADLHLIAGEQRAVVHRHPWLVAALSHRQPLGPAALAFLEFALAVLEPAGLDAAAALETISLLVGFVVNLARAELADRDAPVDPAEAAAQSVRLRQLLATGRYPRFTAAVARGGEPGIDLTAHFERLLDRVIDGLIASA